MDPSSRTMEETTVLSPLSLSRILSVFPAEFMNEGRGRTITQRDAGGLEVGLG